MKYLLIDKKTNRVKAVSDERIKYDASVFSSVNINLSEEERNAFDNNETMTYNCKENKVEWEEKAKPKKEITQLVTEIEKAEDWDKAKPQVVDLLNKIIKKYGNT